MIENINKLFHFLHNSSNVVKYRKILIFNAMVLTSKRPSGIIYEITISKMSTRRVLNSTNVVRKTYHFQALSLPFMSFIVLEAIQFHGIKWKEHILSMMLDILLIIKYVFVRGFWGFFSRYIEYGTLYINYLHLTKRIAICSYISRILNSFITFGIFLFPLFHFIIKLSYKQDFFLHLIFT